MNFKNRIASIVFLVLFIFGAFGCAQLEKLGGLLQDHNAVIVDVAVRHSVFRYIDHADTSEGKAARALRVVEVADKALQTLDADADISTDALMAVIESHIRWEKLDNTEEKIIREILSAVESNLHKRQTEGVLPPDAVISLRGLLNTVIKTASLL